MFNISVLAIKEVLKALAMFVGSFNFLLFKSSIQPLAIQVSCHKKIKSKTIQQHNNKSKPNSVK
jgi:hypothetical protein